jgi:hypothetical protein
MRIPNRAIIWLGTALLLILSFALALPPEFVFLPDNTLGAAAPSRLNDTYIILPDDVMITMRVSKFFIAHGYPGFNVSDISQPATSYLLPIAASPFFILFRDNIALALISLSGALALLLAIFLIAKSTAKLTRWALMSILLLNTTTLEYLLSGWEHLWQSLFVVLCWSAVWKIHEEKSKSIASCAWIGATAAIAVLFRPDSILLVIPAFGWLAMQKDRRTALLPLACFLLIGCAYAALQYQWFGTLTPTTARLKAGQLPSLSYSYHYIATCFTHGSAIAFILVLLAFILKRYNPTLKTPSVYALSGIFSTCIYAFLVSDVFKYGRMYLAPLLLIAFVATKEASNKLKISSNNGELKPLTQSRYEIVLILAASTLLISSVFTATKRQILAATQNSLTPTVEQLFLAKYIERHFTPKDGAVGQFWLGTTSFYLPAYAAADFLGKADEAIAKTKAKWGPPGHNKWDVEASMSKWRPAVIPFPQTIALSSISDRSKAIKSQANYSFWQIYANELTRRGYSFCKPYKDHEYGLYVRGDLTIKVPGCIGPLDSSTQNQP